MKAIKKSTPVEFIKWTGDNLFDVITFTQGKPDLKHSVAAGAWENYCDLVRRDGLRIVPAVVTEIGGIIVKDHVGLMSFDPDMFDMFYDVIE